MTKMKHRILIILFFPLIIWSQHSKDKSTNHHISTVDDFINSFYQSHDNSEEMIPFFDKSYYDTFNKFIEHMTLKNKEYGIFLEKKLKTHSISDENIIWLKYKIKYKKGSMIEELKLKRTTTNSYKIFYWQTHR